MDAATLEPGTVIDLPEPGTDGEIAVERALARRRSRREFAEAPLDITEVGQLLWAAQGITDEEHGTRAAPSAGATFPLEVTLCVGAGGVPKLEAGRYRYRPDTHELEIESLGDHQEGLRGAALDQSWIEHAPVTIVLSAVHERTERQYGDRGRERYVPMEAGHAGENLYLQAETLDLATVAVGAFDDDGVSEVLALPAAERPLYLFPVGRRAADS